MKTFWKITIGLLICALLFYFGIRIGEDQSNTKWNRWAYENKGRTIIFVASDMGELGLQDALDQATNNLKFGGLIIAFPGEFLLTKSLQIKGSNVVMRNWYVNGKFLFDGPALSIQNLSSENEKAERK